VAEFLGDGADGWGGLGCEIQAAINNPTRAKMTAIIVAVLT
jgi:hypothetical protein